MKKIASILLILIITLMGISSCSSSDEKTKEELKAELKEELKEEMKAEIEAENAKSESDNEEDTENAKTESDVEEEINVSAPDDFNWVTEYIDQDIANVMDLENSEYVEDEYDKFVRVTYDDFEITFSTSDSYMLNNHPEDFKKAGIDGNTIVRVFVNLSNDLYDDETETIKRYPEMSFSGAKLGMDFSEAEKLNFSDKSFTFEYSDNGIYAPEKIVGMDFKSKIWSGIINGEYAPEFIVPEIDPNVEVKSPELGMTKEDVITLLGNDYEESQFGDEEFGFYTELKYAGVSVTIPEYFKKADSIYITSNAYSAYDLDIKIGDSALETIKKCEKMYKPIENPHGMENDYIFGMYEIKENIAVVFSFDSYGNINSFEDIKDDTVVQKINIVYVDSVYGI